MTNQSHTFDESLMTATAEGALHAIDQAGPDAEALVQAWMARPNPAAIQEVAQHGSGKPRKAARRALSVLRARGVAIPKPLRRRGVLNEPRKEHAWMLAPDASGIRLLAIARAGRGGGLRACLVYLHDAQGVFRVETKQTTSGKLKQSLLDALPGAGYQPVEVPVEWARHKIAAARKQHAARGVPEPMGFMASRGLIDPKQPAPPPHPFDTEGFAFSEEDAREVANDSGALHQQPEFRAWIPSPAAMQDLLAHVGQRMNPDHPPEQEVVAELLKEEMLAATDRYFTPETRADLVQRMKDAGLSLLAREGEELGLKLAATIQTIEACGLATNPPRDVPFLRAFFEKGVSLLLAQSGGKLNIPMPRPASAS